MQGHKRVRKGADGCFEELQVPVTKEESAWVVVVGVVLCISVPHVYVCKLPGVNTPSFQMPKGVYSLFAASK